MCDHQLLDDPDGLHCTRQDPHSAGHTYAATAGPDLDNASNPKRHANGDDQ